MKIKLCICSETTATELLAITALCNTLALGKGAHVVSGDPVARITVPADCEPTTGYAPVEDAADPTPGDAVHVPAAGTDAPKRRRRTKAEIEAAAAAEAGTTTTTEPEPEVAPEPAPLAEAPAPTPPAPQPDTPPSEPASTAPVSESPSKDYTEAEVQDLAGKVARGVGPEVVKDKIAALGASRIAELTQEQRNDLGAFLTAKLP